MVVERAEEKGQSVVEFLLMLPLLVGITMMLVRVNTAIQMSLVNQQYARAQALWLAFNSSVYPELKQRVGNFVPYKYNKMIMGVADNVIPAEGGTAQPEASTMDIRRTQRSPAGNDSPKSEPEQRTKVRVRATVTLCTQNNVVGKDGTDVLHLEAAGGAGKVARFVATRPYAIGEGTTFTYCGGPYSE